VNDFLSGRIKLPRPLIRAFRNGQAMVEFALIATLALVVLLVGIQFALIGQAALAVSQASYLGARFASVNTNALQADVIAQINAQGSPTITTPANALTVTMTCLDSANASIACAAPRPFGEQVSVNIRYDATSKIFLPSNTLLGITFPTNLTATENAMTE
jgi:Flp pilus assembly protein TadG